MANSKTVLDWISRLAELAEEMQSEAGETDDFEEKDQLEQVAETLRELQSDLEVFGETY